MCRNLLIVLLLLKCAGSYGQHIFATESLNELAPQVTFEYSDKWKELARDARSLRLSIQDSLVSNMGLKMNFASRLYNFERSGLSMELVALSLFNFRSINYDTIKIDGRQGYVLSQRNTYRSEERIIQDIYIDFPQHSSLHISISGSNELFKKNSKEIDSIIKSIKISESQFPQTVVKISQDVYERDITTDYERFVNDSILSELFLARKIQIGSKTEIKNLLAFFDWKRNGKDSLTRIQNNNLLLSIDWLDFTAFSVEVDGQDVRMDFFVNEVNLLTLNTELLGPVFIKDEALQALHLFYIDYRTRKVIDDGAYVMDEKNEILEAPYILINGEVYPFKHGQLYWH